MNKQEMVQKAVADMEKAKDELNEAKFDKDIAAARLDRAYVAEEKAWANWEEANALPDDYDGEMPT